MHNKCKYFFKKKKTLWILAIFALFLITIYLITYNCEPIKGLSVDEANAIWSIIINLSCGYIVSLMFYLILVFKTEYQTYYRRLTTGKRVYEYYLRMHTHIKEILNIYSQMDLKMETDKGYRDLKHKECWAYGEVMECDKAFKRAAYEVQKNIDKIEPHLNDLSQSAVDVLVDIQRSYIFENVDNKDEIIFDLAVMSFMDRVESSCEKLKTLLDSGLSEIMNKEC